MFVTAAISDTIALIPIALVLLLFPFAVGLLANVAAEQTPGGQLQPPRLYTYFTAWPISVLAIVGFCFIAENFASWGVVVVIYGVLGFFMSLVSLIMLLIARAKA